MALLSYLPLSKIQETLQIAIGEREQISLFVFFLDKMIEKKIFMSFCFLKSITRGKDKGENLGKVHKTSETKMTD